MLRACQLALADNYGEQEERWRELNSQRADEFEALENKAYTQAAQEWTEAVCRCFPDRMIYPAQQGTRIPEDLMEGQDDESCLVAGLMLFVP